MKPRRGGPNRLRLGCRLAGRPASRALLSLIVAAAAATAAAATAHAGGTARLQAPHTADMARAGRSVADTVVAPSALRRLSLAGYWGGRFTTAGGELVTVFVSDDFEEDQATGQRWADFLGSLVHGSELSTVTVYFSSSQELRATCGRGAVACYGPREGAIFAPATDPFPDLSSETVVTHEYGHHVAANRDNAPWAAIDRGTKRWSSYVNVCAKTRSGDLFPGAQDPLHYVFNPGEGFAEAYRVLNERKAGLVESPWDVVDRVFHPNATALGRLELDVVSPWAGPATLRYGAPLTKRARSRAYSIATALDGRMTATVRASAKARLSLAVFSGKKRLARATTTAGQRVRTFRITVCGHRSLRFQVNRTRGAGSFTLAIARP